ncbi:latent-transforming growth factor beta-binding protein 2-like isoform X3 [Stigmatopora argus]
MERRSLVSLALLVVTLVRVSDGSADTSTGGRKGLMRWDNPEAGERSPPKTTHARGDVGLLLNAAPRTARHPRSVTHTQPRNRVNRRRLVGPNVCGGQQCCSGWAVAPGSNRCIKPDCQPPCQNRGSCSRPHTCVCRSGFQGPRCEEVAPEQVYIHERGSLRRVQPGSNPFQRDQPRRRPGDRQAIDSTKGQTPRPATTRQPAQTATQVRRGPPDSSPQLTGTSRTVKRYPSSSGPITSNALPNGNTHGNERRNFHGQRNGHDNIHYFNGHRSTANHQLNGHFNNALSPAGANLTSSLDRIKIVFTPTTCRRVCGNGRCYNSCEKGDVTTVYSETSQQQQQLQQQQPKTPGFRLFFCQIPCRNGGRCIGRDQCWCPSNSTGKFCHLPTQPHARPTNHKDSRNSGPKSPSHSTYTLPLSNQLVSLHPSLVKVHIQHPPEAEVRIHQVARVQPGQRSPSTEGAHSVQQRSQPGNGHELAIDHGGRNGHASVDGHSRSHHHHNGHVGRCFQETVDGQCGKPLPGLTKQDDCCGSIGSSWGLNKCHKCPTKPTYAVISNGQVECPLGYKRMNASHCQDINECLLPGICKNADCLNTKGSYRCTCKPGFMLDPARSHCVSDKAVSDQKAFCYRSVSASTCSLPLSQYITKQICCCSRVGKAWGDGCDRCPLPGSDHFKEICPAGHGYTYSRSDVQISLRQLGEEDLQNTGLSWEEQNPTHPQLPSFQPQYPNYPQTPEISQRPEYPESPQHPATSQQPPHSFNPDGEKPQQPEDVEIPRLPAVVTDSPLKYPEHAPDQPANSDPKETAHTDSVGVDNCAITPSICGHGKCVPVQTGYTCQCEPGFKLSALQTNCIDVNECEADPCEGKGSCTNSYGSFNCQCFTGYSQVITQNRKFCQDIDECSIPNKCQNGHCVNTEGSYNCECGNGFVKSHRGLCEDVDECQDPTTCPDGGCVNTVGSFRCQVCSPGFRPISNRCIDVNECLNQNICGRGRCVNSEGSYRCNCFQGYKLTLDNVCQDVNECLLPGICPHGYCTNLEGTYKCICDQGFQPTSDNKACEDIDECASSRKCLEGICVNMPGSFTCQNCNPGFRPSDDGLRCEDVDECSQGDWCLGGVCANTAGSYTCTRCKAGYKVSPDRRRCEDIDECQSLSTCTNGICLNSEGSYTCKNCPTGYTVSYDGELCEDIDECTLPTTCPRGTCTNTEGSYTCVSCQAGYKVSEDGQQCDDVDECLVANVCPGQLCSNTQGSYTCRSCGPGLQLSEDGYGCEDVNECQTPGLCPSGICINTQGSYSCIDCDPGFIAGPNGLSCEDVNECEDAGLCVGGQCTNTIGSYICACPPGLELIDGTSCRDIDECLTIAGLCGEGQCLNTDRSYMCICPDGFETLDRHSGCRDVDECSKDNVCTRGQCLNTEGSFMCLCEAGFKYNEDTADCEDIDECLNQTICGKHGFCENTDGSYRCECNLGYSNPPGDTSTCVDVNECEMSLALCGETLCENFDGSFLCICPNANEEFDTTTSRCRSLGDTDLKPSISAAPSAEERKECYYNLNDANFCDNVLSRNSTKQECCCTVGAGWGDNCEIHACPAQKGDDYHQLCPHGNGYIPHPTSTTQSPSEQRIYIDANECEMFGSDICKNGQCVNLFPTYTCYCRSGFYYDNVRLECVDYDECEFKNSCVDGACVNTPGSFNCFCSPPLVLDSSRQRCIGVNTTEETIESNSDVHMDICWQRLEGDNVCSDPLQGRRTTYTECCCLYGIAWSGQCAFCPRKDSEDYAVMCNLPFRGGSDSLRERPGYEYGVDGPEDPMEPFAPSYWDNYGGPAGPYNAPAGVPLFNDNDYSVRQPPPRFPVQRPREHQPWLVDSFSERYDSFEGLQAEECGILNGCENGRCVRVREGYTCDCFDGYLLDLNKMACIDINECEDLSEKVPLCQNGHCSNTEGSYKCTCLPGFVASAKPHQCIPAIPEPALPEMEN